MRRRRSHLANPDALAAAAGAVLLLVACGSSFESASTACSDNAPACDGGADASSVISPFDATTTMVNDATRGDDDANADADATTDAANGGGDDAGQMDADADAGTETGCSAGTYCAAVLATAPVAYFRFEDSPLPGGGATPLADATGHGYVASASGSFTLGAPPAPVDATEHALRFTNGSITVTALATNDPNYVDLSFPNQAHFSIAGWFELDSLDAGAGTGGYEFGSKTTSPLRGYLVYLGNFLGFEARDSSNTLFSYIHAPAADMPTTVFAHVAFTWDGTAPTMYIRGAALPSNGGSTKNAASGNALSDDTANFVITLTAGSVDEYALYNRTLSAAEVAALATVH